MLERFLHLVFPIKCLGCGREVAEERLLCENCLSSIRLHQTLFCGQCQARLGEGKRVCHQSFPYLLGAATNYEGVVKDLIHALKFKGITKLQEPLGEVLASYVRSIPLEWKSFVVVPIPLGKQRERERGFNQSLLIARVLADRLGLELLDGGLIRIRDTSPQSEAKNRAQRLINIRGSFTMPLVATIARKSVILVDDVTTSGATLQEAARTLRAAGVRKIVALVLARA